MKKDLEMFISKLSLGLSGTNGTIKMLYSVNITWVLKT